MEALISCGIARMIALAPAAMNVTTATMPFDHDARHRDRPREWAAQDEVRPRLWRFRPIRTRRERKVGRDAHDGGEDRGRERGFATVRRPPACQPPTGSGVTNTM